MHLMEKPWSKKLVYEVISSKYCLFTVQLISDTSHKDHISIIV